MPENNPHSDGRRQPTKRPPSGDLLVSALAACGAALCAPLLPEPAVTAPLLTAATFGLCLNRLLALRASQRPRHPQE
ncbi:hypothetical protein [Deinococcus soli (ex Cha et al. 2016)]|uniref:Uncharacterized protein n=2 Tax=Deinococcus soli (ex Cha et al. 2016) TaxID=1309411 RepID=A0ACC6KH43_9DEIO|nr:hypothetical protein [Deinococcus soli (ex Cha et al. 2016)]MDR6218901.1 hypothetical protein [Deinococcus soli (ex Cha et al. 2016)]MDR6328698.1 hypothetical protein [Deinococcus soli (ex Cha et al. 2016)]MDR6751815.1 hypothetical protein [Deinococcus soli (ex Cha et al. 2016)]